MLGCCVGGNRSGKASRAPQGASTLCRPHLIHTAVVLPANRIGGETVQQSLAAVHLCRLEQPRLPGYAQVSNTKHCSQTCSSPHQLSTNDRMTRSPARSASAITTSRPLNTSSSYWPGAV